ncbi:hypothetical protein OG689_42850 [Kitasatospora sp. NBC_00240]|uniref:WXG100-like domain-containing protein n=1 Tax=Kitasatospora sp. NBC_00240 TaxID=2903567 RepID=UPI002251EB0B|nr:hypothetical protein [Kitasatospora sp. NBC_00240]MCX5215886.1 hypothetical protein [Kitasatospora sp. NBC_00240]
MSLDLPPWLRSVAHYVVGVWPSADEDALRVLAGVYEAAALEAQGLAESLAWQSSSVPGWEGDARQAHDAMVERVLRKSGLADVVSAATGIAAGVRETAAQVEKAKYEAIIILAWLVASIAWAWALAPWTGGASLGWLAAAEALAQRLLGEVRQWLVRAVVAAGTGAAFMMSADGLSQAIVIAEGHSDRFDVKSFLVSAGMGAAAGMVGLGVMSALTKGEVAARVALTGGEAGDKLVLPEWSMSMPGQMAQQAGVSEATDVALQKLQGTRVTDAGSAATQGLVDGLASRHGAHTAAGGAPKGLAETLARLKTDAARLGPFEAVPDSGKGFPLPGGLRLEITTGGAWWARPLAGGVAPGGTAFNSAVRTMGVGQDGRPRLVVGTPDMPSGVAVQRLETVWGAVLQAPRRPTELPQEIILATPVGPDELAGVQTFVAGHGVTVSAPNGQLLAGAGDRSAQTAGVTAAGQWLHITPTSAAAARVAATAQTASQPNTVPVGAEPAPADRPGTPAVQQSVVSGPTTAQSTRAARVPDVPDSQTGQGTGAGVPKTTAGNSVTSGDPTPPPTQASATPDTASAPRTATGVTALDSGATMVTGGGQWNRFRPGQPAHHEGPLFPAPAWDTAVQTAAAEPADGGQVHRIPAGLRLDTPDRPPAPDTAAALTALAPTARGPVVAITADPTHPTTRTALNRLLQNLTRQPNPPDLLHLLFTHPQGDLMRPGTPGVETARHLLQDLADTHGLGLVVAQGAWTPTADGTLCPVDPDTTETTPAWHRYGPTAQTSHPAPGDRTGRAPSEEGSTSAQDDVAWLAQPVAPVDEAVWREQSAAVHEYARSSEDLVAVVVELFQAHLQLGRARVLVDGPGSSLSPQIHAAAELRLAQTLDLLTAAETHFDVCSSRIVALGLARVADEYELDSAGNPGALREADKLLGRARIVIGADSESERIRKAQQRVRELVAEQIRSGSPAEALAAAHGAGLFTKSGLAGGALEVAGRNLTKAFRMQSRMIESDVRDAITERERSLAVETAEAEQHSAEVVDEVGQAARAQALHNHRVSAEHEIAEMKHQAPSEVLSRQRRYLVELIEGLKQRLAMEQTGALPGVRLLSQRELDGFNKNLTRVEFKLRKMIVEPTGHRGYHELLERSIGRYPDFGAKMFDAKYNNATELARGLSGWGEAKENRHNEKLLAQQIFADGQVEELINVLLARIWRRLPDLPNADLITSELASGVSSFEPGRHLGQYMPYFHGATLPPHLKHLEAMTWREPDHVLAVLREPTRFDLREKVMVLHDLADYFDNPKHTPRTHGSGMLPDTPGVKQSTTEVDAGGYRVASSTGRVRNPIVRPDGTTKNHQQTSNENAAWTILARERRIPVWAGPSYTAQGFGVVA